MAKDASESNGLVSQGYRYLGLNPVHLRGAMTVGWRAPDRTIDMNISLGQISNHNMRWWGSFEIVMEPCVVR